jgi:hypothetical protein
VHVGTAVNWRPPLSWTPAPGNEGTGLEIQSLAFRLVLLPPAVSKKIQGTAFSYRSQSQRVPTSWVAIWVAPSGKLGLGDSSRSALRLFEGGSSIKAPQQEIRSLQRQANVNSVAPLPDGAPAVFSVPIAWRRAFLLSSAP